MSTTDQLISVAQCIDRCVPNGMKMAVLVGSASGIHPAPPSGNFRITDATDIRITESGDPRIIE